MKIWYTDCTSEMRAEQLKMSYFAPKKLFGNRIANRSKIQYYAYT